MPLRGAETPDPRLCRIPVCALTGWPPLTWLVIDGKHLTKPPKDWHPSAQDTGAGTAYIEVATSPGEAETDPRVQGLFPECSCCCLDHRRQLLCFASAPER